MRIGIITENYFPSVGGTEISILNYTRQLQELGHEVVIFCPSLGLKNPKNEDKNIVRLKSVRKVYPDHPLFCLYPGITRKFKNYKLDILHSQSPITAAYLGKYVSKKLDIPHVHTMHTLVPEQVKRWKIGLLRFASLYFMQSILLKTFRMPKDYLLQDEKLTLSLKVRLSWIYMLRLVTIPDTVIFPSKHVKEIFKARGFTGSSHLLPTFSSMFKKPIARPNNRNNQTIRIIYVGRLDIEKRPQVVLDAMNLLPEYLEWKLVIIGSGSQETKLRKLARKYRIEERVVFKGRLPQDEIAEELLKADIFVMPSYRFDTQGIVFLEACGAGLPIVYCDDNLTVGVETSNSVLSKPYAMSMAQKIQFLIENDDTRKELATNSLEVVKKYKPEILTKKLLRIYKKTIAETDN